MTQIGAMLVILAALLFIPAVAASQQPSVQPRITVVTVPTTTVEDIISKTKLHQQVQAYLELKHSPLADHVDTLLQQKNWKLLVAISAIESQYCTRQLGNNCWGIGGDAHYKYYNSIDDAIVDAETLIDSWQSKGKWLTPEQMNCSYVVPCNPNWVRTVNEVTSELNTYGQ